MLGHSLTTALRRVGLPIAVLIGVLAWNTAFASGSPATGRPDHSGLPHLMVPFHPPQLSSGASGTPAAKGGSGSHGGGGGSHGGHGGGSTPGPHNSCCTPPLINHGGPVESPADVFVDFWGPQWTAGWPDVAANPCAGGYFNKCDQVGPTSYSNAAATVQTYVNDFFTAVASGTSPTWNSSQSQYGSKTPPLYGGAWTDTSSAPPAPAVTDNCSLVVACVVDQPPPVGDVQAATSQLETEALAAESHFGYSPNADYMIFLPRGSNPVGFGAVYCAYHDEMFDGQGRRISFSVIPYMPDGNFGCGENYINETDDAYGHGFLDGYSIVAGHEMAEAETDPLPFTAPAWVTSDGGENGDLCAWGTVTTYPAGNISSGSSFWAAQSLWSNQANACVMN